jgi:type VI secretion system protein ImpH
MLVREAPAFSFFQAVSLLEEHFAVSGNDGAIESGRIRFASDHRTTFSAGDLGGCRATADGILLVPAFMGLTGASSALPQYFAESVLRHDGEDGPLQDFLTIFSNRLYALFYEAWRRFRTVPGGAAGTRERELTTALASLLGPRQKHAHQCGGLFLGTARGSAGLRALLSHALGGVPVAVGQFVPRTVAVPGRKCLGNGTRLGIDTVAGDRVADLAGKFRVVLGPLTRKQHRSLLPGSERLRLAKALINSYLAEPLAYDIELRLSGSEAVPVRPGSDSAALGQTASLGMLRDGSTCQTVVYSEE